MRTLVDLLHTEQGYARIFHDQDGYSYELHSYASAATPDLFTRVLGFASSEEATEAARQMLATMFARPGGKSSRAARSLKMPCRRQVAQLSLRVNSR